MQAIHHETRLQEYATKQDHNDFAEIVAVSFKKVQDQIFDLHDKIDKLEQKIDKKFTEIDARFDRLEARIDKLETKIDIVIELLTKKP